MKIFQMVFQLCSGQEICALKKQREITKTTSMASVVILANDTPLGRGLNMSTFMKIFQRVFEICSGQEISAKKEK